jgi:mannosyltransferase OCH1-like enzyme
MSAKQTILSIIKKLEFILCKTIDKFTEYPLRPIDNYLSREPIRQKIPAIVYQTWVDNSFGKSHLKELDKFRSDNQDLSFILYDEIAMNEYMFNNWKEHQIYNIYILAKYGPMKVDIFRYCIIFDKGGYYFDINKGVNGSITELHDRDSTGLISFEGNNNLILPNERVISKVKHPDRLILQWGFGFEKNHIFMENIIKNICDSYSLFKGKVFENPKNAILTFTGPGMFTKTFFETLENNNLINISQAGIDFNGKGVINLKGSHVRYYSQSSYANFSNNAIVD